MTDDRSDDRLLNPAYNIPGIDVWSQPHISPTVDPDVAPFLCVKFNQEWLQYILPALDVLRWEDYYLGTPGEQAIQAQRGMQLLTMFMLAELCEGAMDFRPKPGSPCVLQYSKNDGLTWLDAFDFSACFGSIDAPSQPSMIEIINLINISNQNIIQLGEQYDGTPESIAPDMDYDGSTGDEDRDRVLCAAIGVFVRLIGAVLYGVREKQKEEIGDIINVIAKAVGVAAGALASLAGQPWAAPWFMEAAAALGVVVFGLFLVDELLLDPDEVFLDEASLIPVACCMYEALKGADITQAAFSNSLSGCAPLEGENAERLRQLVEPLLEKDETYFQFLDALQKTYESVVPGTQLPCDCGEWCARWEAADFPGGWSDYNIDNTGYGASLIGTGYQHIDSASFGRFNRAVSLEIDVPFDVVIEQITLTFDYVKGTFATPTEDGVVINLHPDGDNSTGSMDILLAIDGGNMNTGNDLQAQWNGSKTASGAIGVFVRSCRKTTATQDGSVLLKAIEIRGRQDNPFPLFEC